MDRKTKTYKIKHHIREEDRKVLLEQERKNTQENFMGIHGAKELAEQGGIQKAAAIFTHEGMKLFAQLFSNSVENTLRTILPEILDKKIEEVFQGATLGVQMLSETINSTIHNKIDNIAEELINQKIVDKIEEEPVIHQSESVSDITKREIDKIKNHNKTKHRKRKNRRQDPDLDAIVEFLKKQEKAMRLRDIVSATKDTIKWLNNPTNTMNRFMKKDERIQKSGYGVYKYLD